MKHRVHTGVHTGVTEDETQVEEKKQKQVKPTGQNGIKNKAKQDTGKKDKQKIKIKHEKNHLINK